MSYEFRIKAIRVPLFNIVESDNREPFWTAFADSAASQSSIEFDDSVLDLIASELEFDAEGLANEASRYVGGDYRLKARGLTGGTLGTFGEIICYLINQADPDRKIVRVVSYRSDGLSSSGNRFPQPDFLIEQAGQIGVLEVKTTEALNFQDFVQAEQKRARFKKLSPCTGVANCRNEALLQLGYVKGQPTPQQHKLVPSRGPIVPFPASFAVATAMLVQDGRLDTFRSNARFTTPPGCRARNRDCWACLGPHSYPYHVIATEMRNAPGRLPLVPPGQGGSAWLAAYRKWTHAMWARSTTAAASTGARLEEMLHMWLGSIVGEQAGRGILWNFWQSYLRDVAFDRGLRDHTDELRSSREATSRIRTEDQQKPLREPLVIDVTVKQLVDLWEKVGNGGSSVAFSIYDEKVGTFTARIETSCWLLMCLPREWEGGDAVSDEVAQEIAARLVALALSLGQWARPDFLFAPIGRSWDYTQAEEPSTHLPIPLRRVHVRLGERSQHLGWVVKTVADDPAAWPGKPFPGAPWAQWGIGKPKVGPLWLALLAHGDRRTRLEIMPDGRSRLRVPILPGSIRTKVW